MTEINFENMSNEELKELTKSINAELRERRKLTRVSTSEIRYGLAKVFIDFNNKEKVRYTFKTKTVPNDYFLEIFSTYDKQELIEKMHRFQIDIECVIRDLLNNEYMQEINQDADPRINPFYGNK